MVRYGWAISNSHKMIHLKLCAQMNTSRFYNKFSAKNVIRFWCYLDSILLKILHLLRLRKLYLAGYINNWHHILINVFSKNIFFCRSWYQPVARHQFLRYHFLLEVPQPHCHQARWSQPLLDRRTTFPNCSGNQHCTWSPTLLLWADANSDG